MAADVLMGANAGDCPRNKLVEATSVEAHHNADNKKELTGNWLIAVLM